MIRPHRSRPPKSMLRGALCALLALASLTAVSPVLGSSVAPQGLFVDLAPDRARQVAVAEGKLLLVYGWADWCSPCRRMRRTTWADPVVTDVIGRHVVAVRIDTDRQPDTARALGIDALPTLILYRGSEEIDRVVGYVGPGDLLARLRAALRGEI